MFRFTIGLLVGLAMVALGTAARADYVTVGGAIAPRAGNAVFLPNGVVAHVNGNQVWVSDGRVGYVNGNTAWIPPAQPMRVEAAALTQPLYAPISYAPPPLVPPPLVRLPLVPPPRPPLVATPQQQ